MENKKTLPATQQPLTQQHLMAHHVHPDQIYSQQHPQMTTNLTSLQTGQLQPNGVMQQLLQSQYQSNMDARSPLLENRHEIYGTGHSHDYTKHYGANDNYNYPQSPPKLERTDIHTDHNVNHELLHNIPKGYNAEVYQDYLKRNPPKDTNQIYQNHQPMYRPNLNQYGSKPYLPYSNRIGPQSNTELLRRQYNEIQQMKIQQQLHYQNQAQMHQQQKFAERQLLLQQLHGVQPPPNLQNSIYSDGSYRDLDRYSSKNDFKDYSSPDIQKDFDRYAKNNEFKEMDKQNRQYQESQWQPNHPTDFRESDRYTKQLEGDKRKTQFPPDFNNQGQKNNVGVISPMKSSESSSSSIKSPSSESRRSSGGNQALRSPIAQRIPSAPVTMSGILYKQGSDGLKVWRKRWFVLSEFCLFYYKSQDEEKLLGSVLLPSYKVSACRAEDKVLRKFAFKLEHANMRTYVLAAPDYEAMMKWVKALTMAALMQTPSDQPQKPSEHTAAKTEEDDETAGPTYANAPPKPRRSNEGYNSPSPDMSRGHQKQQVTQEKKQKQIYEAQSQRNPFIQNSTPQTETLPNDSDMQNKNIHPALEKDQAKPIQNESYSETRSNTTQNIDANPFNKDVYGELNTKPNKVSGTNERLLIERRTPDAYGRPTTMSAYNKGKVGDYEDVYASYTTENEYGQMFAKSPNPSQSRDTVSMSSHQQSQEYTGSYTQEKTFSGPSILRRKKMQSSGIQPPMPRPHSADFLEYESKSEMLNKTMPNRVACDPPRQPQRPKSSLDINSCYDPSSDRYYSEESYAEKMRQSAQYLQQGLGPRNIQVPLAKYASGLVEKQLHSPYSQTTNNNYETEFGVNRVNRDNVSYNSKYSDLEGLNSNWTLKEKDAENQKEYLNRSGSVVSDGSNVSGYVKDMSRYDSSAEGFMRSASARLPSSATEKDGEKKVQQREESMKRLLEWKQRMLQSPLTRKSTPATISLARSLHQSRQSLRTDQFKPKTYTNASYNSYSSDDEASMTMSNTNIESGTNNSSNQQTLSKKAFLGSNTSIGRSNRDANIPVRAVSPRVRWVEEKPSNDHYGSQQIMNSQQNIHTLTMARSPSRAMQQPIRAVSPRVRRNTENNDTQREVPKSGQVEQLGEVPTAGELLGRTHEELVLLLIQLRRRHAATHRAIEQCCVQIHSIEDSITSLKAMEREESLQRLEQLKMQLMELEHQYEKSKPLVQLVDNMVKLGSLYNRPGSTVERLERNQRLRQKVLAEHALEQQRWLESAAAGKALETEAARARVAELWALEQELADEAAILHGLKTDKDTIESLLTGVRGKLDNVPRSDLSARGMTTTNVSTGGNLEAELARVHAMLALNSKKLEQTVADNARLERELQQLRRALQARRAAAPATTFPPHAAHAAHPAHPAHATAMLEDEVSRVQQLVSALQRQRQELSRAVRHLTQQSHALQTTHDSIPGKRRPNSSWQETNLDTSHTIDHGSSDYDYDTSGPLLSPGHYEPSNVETPLYVDTRPPGADVISPLTSEEIQHTSFGNLNNVEKQEIKTVRIVKRESERRQRDRERSLQPVTDWSNSNITANLDQFLEEELIQPPNYSRASSVPRSEYSKYDDCYTKSHAEPPNYLRFSEKMSSIELSPKYPSSPSLSNYDYSRDVSLSSSYQKSYDRSGYDRTISFSNQYLNSPTDSSKTLTNDPLSKTSSIGSLNRSHMELSPIFKSEAAKQIITEMSGDGSKNGSIHRRQVPKEKRRHYTAPHHLSAKTLNEMPRDAYNQDRGGRSLDDVDLERVLRAPPDVVRSALPHDPRDPLDPRDLLHPRDPLDLRDPLDPLDPRDPLDPQRARCTSRSQRPQRLAAATIDQLLAAPQKILIPERYIPEKPPELSPEEQQKRQEKVESIKKMLSSSSADPTKSPDGEDKRQREHLLQMNQILAKQVTEMSKIIAGTNTEQGPSTTNN